MKKVSYLLVVFIIAFSFVGCKKAKTKVKNEENVNYVSTMSVDYMTLNDEYQTSGTLKGIEDLFVFSKINGKLIRYTVKEGTYVKKDQIIAYIDRDVTGLKFEPATVKSPINGIVSEIFLDKGEMVIPGQKPIAKVANMNIMELDINVPEKYITKLKKGLKVVVEADAYPNKKFIGYINSVSPASDPMTHTFKIKIYINNSKKVLRSGMFVRAHLIFAKKHVLALPEEAVINKKFVYVVENGIAKVKPVEIGIFYNTYLEIKKGLKKGEKVVVAGQKYLDDGVKVKER